MAYYLHISMCKGLILNLNLKTTKIHTQYFKQMITMDVNCAELETAGNEV